MAGCISSDLPQICPVLVPEAEIGLAPKNDQKEPSEWGDTRLPPKSKIAGKRTIRNSSIWKNWYWIGMEGRKMAYFSGGKGLPFDRSVSMEKLEILEFLLVPPGLYFDLLMVRSSATPYKKAIFGIYLILK